MAAAVLIVIMLGGSWKMAVNAEKHGGFFWCMDNNEEGTTMTSGSDSGTAEGSQENRVPG